MKTDKKNILTTNLNKTPESLKYMNNNYRTFIEGYKDPAEIISLVNGIQKNLYCFDKVFHDNIENTLLTGKHISVIEQYLPLTCNYLPVIIKHLPETIKSFPLNFKHSGESPGHSQMINNKPQTYSDIILNAYGELTELMTHFPETINSFLIKLKDYSKSLILCRLIVNILCVYVPGMFEYNRHLIPDNCGIFYSNLQTYFKQKNVSVLVRRFPVLHISFYMQHGETGKAIFY